MTRRTLILSVLSSFAIMSCANGTSSPNATMAQSKSALEPCLVEAMDMMVGTWEYTSTIERISGGYRTFQTRSIHEKERDKFWSSRAFGGDIPAEESNEIEYERVSGNQILQVIDGEDQTSDARTFSSCEGPDDVGRIKTTSTYQFPLNEDGTGILYAENYSSFSNGGTFFFEKIRNEDGEIIARTSGVTVPVDGN